MRRGLLSNVGYRPIVKINKIYDKTLLDVEREGFKGAKSSKLQERLLILEHHASLDRGMAMLLSYYFAYRHNRKEMWELQELVLSKLGFEEKRQLIKKLKFFNGDNEVYKKLEYINQLRNVIAHSQAWQNPKMRFSNEMAMSKKSFVKFKSDYQELQKKFLAFDFALREGLDIKHF